MECLGAGLCAVSRVKEPAPREGATFPGKPRNPDECLRVQVFYLLNRDGGDGRGQSIANATTISPNMPTQMIVLVVLSIVCLVGLVPAGWRPQAASRMGSSTVDAGA